MSAADVITYCEDGVWKTRVDGNTRASRISPDRGDAVAFGRRLARERGARHVVLDPVDSKAADSRRGRVDNLGA